MWILAAIIALFILFVFFIAWALPVLIGLIMIVVGNVLHRLDRGEIAPFWWNATAVVITILSTIWWNIDIFSESMDTGPAPIIIVFGIYAFSSLLFIAFRSSAAKKKEILITYEVEEFDEEAYDDAEDEYDDELLAKEICAKLKNNLRVDTEFWDERHLEFKCNLVASSDLLQLHYEIKNKSGTPWRYRDGGIEITAIIYNANGELLCVEEEYIDDDDLAKKRYASSILFYFDDMQEADYIEVFANQDI